MKLAKPPECAARRLLGRQKSLNWPPLESRGQRSFARPLGAPHSMQRVPLTALQSGRCWLAETSRRSPGSPARCAPFGQPNCIFIGLVSANATKSIQVSFSYKPGRVKYTGRLGRRQMLSFANANGAPPPLGVSMFPGRNWRQAQPRKQTNGPRHTNLVGTWTWLERLQI